MCLGRLRQDTTDRFACRKFPLVQSRHLLYSTLLLYSILRLLYPFGFGGVKCSVCYLQGPLPRSIFDFRFSIFDWDPWIPLLRSAAPHPLIPLSPCSLTSFGGRGGLFCRGVIICWREKEASQRRVLKTPGLKGQPSSGRKPLLGDTSWLVLSLMCRVLPFSPVLLFVGAGRSLSAQDGACALQPSL
jgi:hypothetical protein